VIFFLAFTIATALPFISFFQICYLCFIVTAQVIQYEKQV